MSLDPALLSNLYPLDSLRSDTRAHLAADAGTLDYAAGEWLFRAGDFDEDMVYLLAGAITGHYPDGREKRIEAGSLQARYPLGEAQPRRFGAQVGEDGAQVARIDRRSCEKLLAWDQLCRQRIEQADSAEDPSWVFRLLGNRAFTRLPTGNIERMFASFEEVRVNAGDEVIREGAEPDYFYVIKQGAAAVSKTLKGREVQVAQLQRGDCFGEDALLSNHPRNASVRMSTAGRLMRLSREKFDAVLKPPAVDWIEAAEAAAYTRRGAAVVDVRLPSEFRQRALRGAINIPLAQLREGALERIAAGTPVLVYCNSGERSAAACFILSRLGYPTRALQGGLGGVLRQQAQAKA
jgi:CRP-like cAMP-binding protein/rhodanese-related sulfurtransferase